MYRGGSDQESADPPVERALMERIVYGQTGGLAAWIHVGVGNRGASA